jgi:hypothetical protein
MMKNSGFARYFFGRYSNNFYFFGCFFLCMSKKSSNFARFFAYMRVYAYSSHEKKAKLMFNFLTESEVVFRRIGAKARGEKGDV